MLKNKHYIKHDEFENVIDYASDGAGKSKIDDSFIYLKDGGYQFDWKGVPNPKIRFNDNCPIYKGMMEIRTNEENEIWRMPDPIEQAKQELKTLDNPRDAEDILQLLIDSGVVTQEQINTFLPKQTRERLERKKELRSML